MAPKTCAEPGAGEDGRVKGQAKPSKPPGSAGNICQGKWGGRV